MSPKGKKRPYYLRVEDETVSRLRELAALLDFRVETPGRFLGDPSPGDFLDALAKASRANPDETYEALYAILNNPDALTSLLSNKE